MRFIINSEWYLTTAIDFTYKVKISRSVIMKIKWMAVFNASLALLQSSKLNRYGSCLGTGDCVSRQY